MKEILTEKEIKMIENLANEMQKEANENMSLEENMQISLAGRTENLDEKEEVSNLCKGIRDFHEVLGQLEAGGGKEAILHELERSDLSGKSMKEQYHALAEALEAFRVDLTGKGYDFEELKSLEIKKDVDVTEEMLDELKNTVAEYLDKFALFHGEAEWMENFFQSIGFQASEELLQAYGDEERKYYIALAMYILHLQGEISYMPLGVGAREIGVNVSASVASAKIHIEESAGKISKEEALEKLKKIASAALTVLVSVAIGLAAFKVGQLVFWLSSMIFGFGMVGIVVAAVFCVASQVATIGALLNVWNELKEMAADFKEYISKESGSLGEVASEAKEYLTGKYAIVKQWILGEAIPTLKEFWKNLKEKVSSLFSSFSHAEEEDVNEKFEDVNEEFEDELTDAVMADA